MAEEKDLAVEQALMEARNRHPGAEVSLESIFWNWEGHSWFVDIRSSTGVEMSFDCFEDQGKMVCMLYSER